MDDKDREELEHYREMKKRRKEYTARFQKENYKRIVCLLPIDDVPLFEKARGDQPASSYILSLIDKDIHQRHIV